MKKGITNRWPITVQLLLALLIMVLPLNLLCLFISRNSQNLVTQQAVGSIRSVAESRVQKLETQMEESSLYFHTLLTGNDGTVLLRQRGDADYKNAKYSISRQMQTYMRMSDYAADVYFFYAPLVDDLVVCKDIAYDFYRPNLYAYLERNKLHDQAYSWRVIDFDGRQWLINLMANSGIYIGQMISIDEVVSDIQSSLPYDAESTKIFLSNVEDESPKGWQLIQIPTSYSYHITILVDNQEILGSLPLFERITFTVAIASLMLLPILFFLLKRILIRPLDKIGSAMLRLEHGDIGYRISIHNYPREFIKINNIFNRMADKIQAMKIQQYEDQLERERLYRRNLELQIQPHFLLNTFNLMFSLSQRDDRENLENTILYLSNYFRYIFRNGQQLSPFSVELELVKSYVEIARLRFPGQFEMEYDISPEAMNFQIPPLLVHNFVENTMRHALVRDRVVHIRLGAYKLNRKCFIIIQDDGAGISPEKADRFNRGELSESDGHSHVGLENSYERVHLFLGQEASLQISPGENGIGCKVVISFFQSQEEGQT